MASPAIADDDVFLDYAIEPGTDANVNVGPVEMDAGASPAAVSSFDIAGIMLGMSFDDVYSQFAHNRGLYTIHRGDGIIYTISPDWESNLDYECRGQGIYDPDALRDCINALARNRGLMYASQLRLVRELTGETIAVDFTSNATDNRVWRVVYANDVDDVDGNGAKYDDQREKKILAFWQGILDKYGAPNSGGDKWITSDNAYDPMMTAYYGGLELVDNGRNASDAAKNAASARENFRAKPYAF